MFAPTTATATPQHTCMSLNAGGHNSLIQYLFLSAYHSSGHVGGLVAEEYHALSIISSNTNLSLLKSTWGNAAKLAQGNAWVMFTVHLDSTFESSILMKYV